MEKRIRNLTNWLNLCNKVIDLHAHGKDYKKYAISKGNLQIEDILDWNLLKSFITAILSNQVTITDAQLKQIK